MHKNLSSLLAAESPPQEKPSTAASGSTALRSTKHCQSSNDHRAEVSEVHKRVKHLTHSLVAAAHIQRAPLHCAQRYTVRRATQCAAMHSAAQRPALHSAQRYTAPSASLRTTLHCQRCTVRNIVPPPPPRPAPLRRKPSAAGSGGLGAAAPGNRTKPFAGEAERSGKREYCAAFNEALPVE